MRRKRDGVIPFIAAQGFYMLANVEEMLGAAGFKIANIKSTLLQRPDEPRRVEEPVEGYVKGSGFLCIGATPKKKA
jgi:hypothetical protein